MSELPRIGIGWDRHRLVRGRPCTLGGVLIDCPVGPVGHSDGDAVLHALTDAVLGAAGEEDLGTLYPDSAGEWKGVESTRFLREALNLAQRRGLRVASVDLVIVCDRPKIAPHRALIRTAIAELLALPIDRVNCKGKTTERLHLWRREAVDVTAVALLVEAS